MKERLSKEHLGAARRRERDREEEGANVKKPVLPRPDPCKLMATDLASGRAKIPLHYILQWDLAPGRVLRSFFEPADQMVEGALRLVDHMLTRQPEPPVRVDRRATPGAGRAEPEAVAQALELIRASNAGQPLPAEIAMLLADQLGADLTGVRVHTDDAADRAAVAIGAEAFTVGDHLYFARGRYQPRTPAGLRLIAHEVVHAVQQRSARFQGHLAASMPTDTTELDADEFADDFVAQLGRYLLPTSPIAALRRAADGAPEPVPHRDQMERIFGEDFGSVHVHRGKADALSAHSAAAATMGETVLFADRAPSPELVAHELTHVVQHRRAGRPECATHDVSAEGDAPELEAEQAARAVARGAQHVSVTATPTAAIAFAPAGAGTAPAPMQPPNMSAGVTAAMTAAQKHHIPFARALAQDATIRAVILQSLGERNAAVGDVLAALEKGTARLGVLQAKIDLAGEVAPAAISLDQLIRLLGEVFMSPELTRYGLPASFAQPAILDLVTDELASTFDDAVAAAVAALAGMAPGSAEAREAIRTAIDGALAAHLPAVTGAVHGAVAMWDDPFDLLELELHGAIEQLEALRAELGQVADPAMRPAIGRKLSHLARYVLLLNAHLGDVNQRLARQKTPGKVAPLAALEDVGGDLRAIRGNIGSEQKTLEHLGNRAELLSEQRAHAVTPDAEHLTTKVQPEEAFPAHTDDLALDAQARIAGRIADQKAELRQLHRAIVPQHVKTYGDFKRVYARWFSFFSITEENERIGVLMKAYQSAMPLAGMAGSSGIAFQIGLTRMYGSDILPTTGANSSFLSDVGDMNIRRSETTTDRATEGGRSGVDYDFAEVAKGRGGTGLGAEAGSREAFLQSHIDNRYFAFGGLYDAPSEPLRQRAAVDGGLASANSDLRMWRNKDWRADRHDASSGWSYFLDAELANALGQIKTVQEHKVMREEVARYLLALSQHYQTLYRPHIVKDDGGHHLGDRAARTQGVESSTVEASATYGDGRRDRAEASKRHRGAIEAARENTGPDPRTASRADYYMLIADLEKAMNQFFASASVSDRLSAIVFAIGVQEYDLDETVWKQIRLETLWEFAKQAMKIAALLHGLECFGPAGQIAAGVVREALAVQHKRDVASAMAGLGLWFDGAIGASSFGAARGWAFSFTSIAENLIQVIQDWMGDKLGDRATGILHDLGKSWSEHDGEPKTVGDLRKTLAPVMHDAKARQQLTQQLETALRPHLGADPNKKPLSRQALELWMMLNAIDREGAARIGNKHTELPPIDQTTPLVDSKDGATNAMNAERLRAHLTHKEASSIFKADGTLRPEAINKSTLIIKGTELNNPAVIAALTKDGSSMTDWGKYQTSSFKSPAGKFTVHFYYNAKTDTVNYSIDFKVVFNHQGAWR